jgi:redox-sensitive bicupin YhaK (pirin superfamily)
MHMPKVRDIKQAIEPDYVIEGAGVLLRRSFGPNRANLYDPFLLFDHFAFNDPIEGPIVGFPMHPHRGIETVTYMLEGNTRHRDSLGNMGVIGPGDVQWMTSGRGIMHEEMPKRGPSGRVDGFQLWVNLPASEKMSAPRYQEVKRSDIPVVVQGGATVRVVAGSFGGKRGPVTEISARPLYMDVSLEPGAEFVLATPADHTAMAYLFEGRARMGHAENPGNEVSAVRMVIFQGGDQFKARSADDSSARFMFFAGAPFGEQIVPYGPFVMNTEEEIRQALADLRSGTFVDQRAALA